MQSHQENQQVPALHCKIVFGEEIRRLKLLTPSYLALISTLRTLLNIPRNDAIIIKYRDDEADLITVSTDLELENAISLLPPHALLRLFVSIVPNQLKKPNQCFRGRNQKLIDLKAQFEPRKVILPVALPEDPTQEVIPMKVEFSVKNLGERVWPIGTALVLINKCKKITVLKKISLSESVDVGSSISLSIAFKAPVHGIHKLRWALESPEGKRFGKFLVKTRAPGTEKEKNKNKCHRRWMMRCEPGRMRCMKARACLFGQGTPGQVFNGWASKIASLKEMGFAGPAVFRALKVCGGDVELALNALL